MHALRVCRGRTGRCKPKLLIAPGFTSLRPTDGIAAIELTAGGSGYTDAPVVVISGGGGAGAAANAVIDSARGVVTEVVLRNPGAGFSAPPAVSFSGGAGVGAAAKVTLGVVANPVAIELVGLANRLRACAIVDGPNTSSASRRRLLRPTSPATGC